MHDHNRLRYINQLSRMLGGQWTYCPSAKEWTCDDGRTVDRHHILRGDGLPRRVFFIKPGSKIPAWY